MARVIGDHYELLAEAARGGMGSVYRGRDLRTGRVVAVKLLDLKNPSDFVRFERECSVLADLHHPNIVGYIAHGATREGTPYLVQEWVDGVTLSTQIQMLGLTARDATAVAIGVADALGAAHAHGVVHRDVKPANIILDAGIPDRIKLVDFGIARMEAEAGLLTRAGMLVGTPSYMAPEQARGWVAITPAADVWALGCVLYEAISGRKAFAGRSPEAIRAKALLHEPTRLDSLVPELPQPVADYVHELLAKRVDDRPPTGVEVAERLRELLPMIPSGSLRKANEAESHPTRVEAARKASGSEPSRCFMLVSVPWDEPNQAPRTPIGLDAIAARHHLSMHPLDDGSVLLEAAIDADHSAASVAYAALEIQSQIFDGAISVFGQLGCEALDEAIDRGADRLAEATMASMFVDVVGGEQIIPVDDVMAELLRGEGITLVTTEQGQGIPATRHQTG